MRKWDSPTEDMTVKTLKKWIRERTVDVNARIDSYRRNERESKPFELLISRIKRISGVRKPKSGEIGLGFRGKVKSQLLRQAKALEAFYNFDMYSDKAINEREEQTRKAYERFKHNWGYNDLTIGTYIDTMEALGTIGVDVLGTFDYMGVMDEYVKQVETGKNVNLVAITERAQRVSRDKGWSKMEMTDYIIEEIRKSLVN